LGAEQKEAFDLIRKYLSSAPVLKAPQAGVSFRLYIAAEDKVIGAVMTQETEGKEHVVTYLSRRLVDAETRYTFIERLCLCLFYACTKCRCYLLSSHCTVSGQTDVIKYMLQNPIMSGRVGKWAYALIEYNLAYKLLKSMKGQVVADFIVEHWIDDTHRLDMSYLTITHLTSYFDGSVCNEGQGIVIVLVLPSNASFDFSSRLKICCTNNQDEYEALLFCLDLLNCMGVKHVRAFGDSQLVVQQILEEYQCLEGTLNSYIGKRWDIIRSFDEFNTRHKSRIENYRANNLAQKHIRLSDKAREISQHQKSNNQCRARSLGCGPSERPSRIVRTRFGPSGYGVQTVRHCHGSTRDRFG
jgi:ribonuclease HI